jgi:hypothetical protein
MPVPPRSIHLHKHSPSVLHLPLWASTTGQIRKSQSSEAGAGLSLGENHFPADSLTWREFLTGLTTCLFYQPDNHLPHLERVLHTGQTTCFLQLTTQSGNHEAPHEHTMVCKPHTVKHCATTTVHWKHRHGLPKTGDRQMLQHNKAQQLWDIQFSPTNNTGQTHGSGFGDA